MKISQRDVAAMDDLDNALESESGYTGARRIVIFSLLMFVALGVWAWFGVLDEVSTGSGKVIPSSREQVLQSLDGGILTELNVHEGDQVQEGQVLARLDPTRSESNVGESAARYRASLASSARLNAEVNDLPLTFPPSLAKWPDLIAAETRLYNSRRAQLDDTQRELRAALDLANKELAITQRLSCSFPLSVCVVGAGVGPHSLAFCLLGCEARVPVSRGGGGLAELALAPGPSSAVVGFCLGGFGCWLLWAGGVCGDVCGGFRLAVGGAGGCGLLGGWRGGGPWV